MKKHDTRNDFSPEYRLQIAAGIISAAEVIERDGWCQNVYTSRDGQHCAVGALYAAIGNEDYRTRTDAYILLSSYLNRPKGLFRRNPKTTVTSWNDKEGRTEGEVIGMFHETAMWLVDAG